MHSEGDGGGGRGKNNEVAGRVREGSAYEACMGFPLVSYIKTIFMDVCKFHGYSFKLLEDSVYSNIFLVGATVGW